MSAQHGATIVTVTRSHCYQQELMATTKSIMHIFGSQRNRRRRQNENR